MLPQELAQRDKTIGGICVICVQITTRRGEGYCKNHNGFSGTFSNSNRRLGFRHLFLHFCNFAPGEGFLHIQLCLPQNRGVLETGEAWKP